MAVGNVLTRAAMHAMRYSDKKLTTTVYTDAFRYDVASPFQHQKVCQPERQAKVNQRATNGYWMTQTRQGELIQNTFRLNRLAHSDTLFLRLSTNARPAPRLFITL
jgi:hypothetical protein